MTNVAACLSVCVCAAVPLRSKAEELLALPRRLHAGAEPRVCVSPAGVAVQLLDDSQLPVPPGLWEALAAQESAMDEAAGAASTRSPAEEPRPEEKAEAGPADTPSGGGAEEDEDECPICFDTFQQTPGPDGEVEKVTFLRCFHKFHEACISSWLVS